jgi:hypothetical protein
MSKVVLKNTQTKAVVKVVGSATETIAHADLSYDVLVEIGQPEFNSGQSPASAGEKIRTQVPTHMEISRVIYSNEHNSYANISRGATVVMHLTGNGEIDFEGQVTENESSELPITVASSSGGHEYTVYLFINKIGVA